MSGFIKGGIVDYMYRKTKPTDIPEHPPLLFACVMFCVFFLVSPRAAAEQANTEPRNVEPRNVGTLSPASTAPLFFSGSPYPPWYEWKSITTPHNLLIFPAGQEEAARRAAMIISAAHGPLQEDFGIRAAPYPVILNTSLDIANGYFGLAPRKSEWYSYPGQTQFGGAVDWYTLLAVHEGRHAAQLTALDQGFIRWARLFAGEYGWAGLSFYSVPLWYFEGDAILAETALTGSGRGRSAAFHRELRAMVREKELPSYQQAYLGSYKAHFPGYYHLGYPLVAYVRLMYGADAWNEILMETARFAFWPLRFHRAVKKVTGRTVSQIYSDTMDFMAENWSDCSGGEDFSPVEYLSPESGTWTNYYPVSVNGDGSLNVVVEGDGRPAELIRMDFSSEGERPVGRIFQGQLLDEEGITRIAARDNWVDVRGGQAVWSEAMPHPVWAKVSFSDLVLYDIDTGRPRRFTKEHHLQAPVFSPDGARIAAVEISPGGGSRLLIFDAGNGDMVQASEPPAAIVSAETGAISEGVPTAAPAKAPDAPGKNPAFLAGQHILHPSWSEDGERLVMVGTGGDRSTLLEYRPREHQWKILHGPTWEKIEYPRFWREYILYTSDYSGREEIYALYRRSGERYRVLARPAAVMPLVRADEDDASGESMIFADYGTHGFRLASIALDPGTFTPISEVTERHMDYADVLFSDEDASKLAGGFSESARNDVYPVETYHPSAHLLNFHSWGLLPTWEGRAELFARSDDPLGLLSLRTFAGINPAGARYDTGFQGIYRGLFPLLQFGVSGDINYPGDVSRQYCGFTGLLGLQAPLNFSRGIWNRTVSIGTTAFFRIEEPGPSTPYDQADMVLPIRHSILLYNGTGGLARKDFAPEWEQYSHWNWYYVPLQEEYAGWRLEQRGHLLFPGFFPQHRLGAGLNVEWKQGEDIPLDIVPIRPRGYSFDWSDEYPADLVASVEYTLPLISPDLEIGHVYYLKRILLTLFTDVGIGGQDVGAFFYSADQRYYPSSGIELTGEQNFFSWPVSLQAGVRLVYRWRDEMFRAEDTFFTLGFDW